jgi:hypothetical protein
MLLQGDDVRAEPKCAIAVSLSACPDETTRVIRGSGSCLTVYLYAHFVRTLEHRLFCMNLIY